MKTWIENAFMKKCRRNYKVEGVVNDPKEPDMLRIVTIFAGWKNRDSRVEGNNAKEDTSGKRNRVVFGVLRQIKAWTNPILLISMVEKCERNWWKWLCC